ncbi:LLM class flavin-dependent oxidoreductase [Micromonospora sp. SL4-19]|uniref:LLM class flavin-dependent oxidoreductase n=1 Tax=Micromonospora sp. SL4-19 TaxID=3399129 RepID=UPI003A4DAF39
MEPHHGFVAAAGAGFRVPTGIGVSLMPLRHPYEAAMQARSVALATGHPVVAGFGPGSRDFQTNIMGAPYDSPLTTARTYVQVVRRLLDGEVVRLDGPELRLNAQLAPAAAAPVEVGLGVLRPKMAMVAGEVADVAITWLTPPSYIRDVLAPALRAGAAKAGRTAPPRIAAMVPVGIDREDVPAETLALASNAAHLQAPHYLDMLRQAGIPLAGRDLQSAARAVVEANAFVRGDLDTVVKRLAEYGEAGVDEIVLNLTGVHKACGPQAAFSDLKTILGVWA